MTSTAIGAGLLFEPGKPGSVSGKVTSDSAAAWVARIDLLDSSGTVLRSTLSDAEGNYHFDSLPAGEYRIVVTHPSSVSYAGELFTLAPEEDRTVSVSMEARITDSAALEDAMKEELDETIAVPFEAGRREKPTAKKHRSRGDGVRMTAPVPTGVHEEMPETGEVYDESFGAGEEGPETSAGTLTAGEINDFSKWVLWEDLTETEFGSYQKRWGFMMRKRFPVQATYENGMPVVDAEVQLVTDQNEVVFMARTDNTGKAELWAEMVPEVNDQRVRKYKAILKSNGETYRFDKLKAWPEGLNTLSIKGTCSTSDILDIAFVVDATGSMGDEINYLKTELQDVIKRVKEQNASLNLRTASVFYRDHNDAYLTRNSDFTSDISTTLGFIRDQYAAGGGDFPEAVDDALNAALNELSWSPGARGRLLFLVLDAPPHQADSIVKRMHQLVYKAAAMGVRIIPVTGSGINKDVEFLMRSMALATNGTYTFLTDHSGVGNKHLEPSTDSYEVEKLNDLLVRLINRYAQATGCEQVGPAPNSDTSLVVKPIQVPRDSVSGGADTLTLHCFPVPTQGPLNMEVNKADGLLFVLDNNGKLILRFDMKERRTVNADLSQLAAGIYHVRYEWKGRWVSDRIMIYH